MVQLSGTVTDQRPQTTTVNFTGVLAGSVQPNSQGSYSLLLQGNQVGVIHAQATDDQGLTSPTVDSTITNQVPQVTLTLTMNQQRSVTLTGTVVDDERSGRPVVLSGVVNATVVTNKMGAFTLTTDASALGQITATTTDSWGQQSQPAMVTVASAKPWLTLECAQVEGNRWTFQGKVYDESPQGLIVTFGGTPELEGQTAVAGPDGSYSLTVELPPGTNCTVTAQTTDWWGLVSDLAICYVR
jgi:hypothetical protein